MRKPRRPRRLALAGLSLYCLQLGWGAYRYSVPILDVTEGHRRFRIWYSALSTWMIPIVGIYNLAAPEPVKLRIDDLTTGTYHVEFDDLAQDFQLRYPFLERHLKK